MTMENFRLTQTQPSGQSIAHLMTLPCCVLGALRPLAGKMGFMCPLRRLAFLVHPMTPHSGASNCRF